MKTGISGSVTAMIAAEIQSCVTMATSTTTGTITASSSFGRYCEKYASSASTPRVASTASSPLARVTARPSRATRATSAVRSCDLARAELRAAATSVPHARSARPTTTASSAASAPDSAATPAPCCIARVTTSAISHAWATTSSAVAAPRATDTTRNTRVARA